MIVEQFYIKILISKIKLAVHKVIPLIHENEKWYKFNNDKWIFGTFYKKAWLNNFEALMNRQIFVVKIWNRKLNQTFENSNNKNHYIFP